MSNITIHRALSELKLIDAKIDKAIGELSPVGRLQKDKLVNQEFTINDFTKNASSKYQTINDLIERKLRVKSAIVKSNSTTKVIVSDKTMTVAEAINYKVIIGHRKNLIKKLEQSYRQNQTTIEQNNNLVQDNALKLAQAALQKDNVKINDGDALAITKPYIDANEFTMIDPLNIIELIEKLSNEVLDFESEVDSVLSESNATTLIDV